MDISWELAFAAEKKSVDTPSCSIFVAFWRSFHGRKLLWKLGISAAHDDYQPEGLVGRSAQRLKGFVIDNSKDGAPIIVSLDILRILLKYRISWKDIQNKGFDSFILHNRHRLTWRFANRISMGVSWTERHLQLHVALCRYHVDPFLITRTMEIIWQDGNRWYSQIWNFGGKLIYIYLYNNIQLGYHFSWICARTHLEIVDKNGSHITQPHSSAASFHATHDSHHLQYVFEWLVWPKRPKKHTESISFFADLFHGS